MPPPTNVVLLIGADTAIVDESSYARTLTPIGAAARTTAQSKFGGASLTFDGTGDWIQTPDSNDFTIGAGDFTIEGWFRFVTKTNNQTLLSHIDAFGSSGFGFLIWLESGLLTFQGGVGGGSQTLTSAWVPTLGQWYHIAVDRIGTTLRLYLDGVVRATNASYSYTLNNPTTPLTLGTIGSTNAFPAYDFNGQMDEIRITKGLAQYAGAFTPPTTAFPRTPGLTRVQATPIISTSVPGTTVSATFPANPTVGKGIVVVVLTGLNQNPAVTDNYGNTYTLVTSTYDINISWIISIFYCSAIAATGASFTITATGGSTSRRIQAVEVNDAIIIDKFTLNKGAFPTPCNSGNTAALTGAEVFVLAVCMSSSPTFVVDTTTPTWFQESELATVGEIDSRSISGAIGITQTVSWTFDGAHYWNCVLAVFKITVATPTSVETVQSVILIG